MRRPHAVLLAFIMLVAAPAVSHAGAVQDPSAPAAPPTEPANPSATIGPVDCVNGGAFANLANTGGQPATFHIQRGWVTIDTIVLESSPVGASRLVPIPEGATMLVSVQMDGFGGVSAWVENACGGPSSADSPAPAEADAADDGTATLPAADTATSIPDGTSAVATAGAALPFTGAVGMTVATASGIALLLLGLSLHVAARRGRSSGSRRTSDV